MTLSIGFRCWSDAIAFVVLDGIARAPSIVASGHVKYPKGYGGPRLFAWLRTEVQAIVDKHAPEVGFVKITEGGPGRAPDQTRLHTEAIVQEAAFSTPLGLELQTRIKTQIKRDTGFAGPAREVDQRVAEPDLATFDNTKFRDACLAAACGLPEE